MHVNWLICLICNHFDSGYCDINLDTVVSIRLTKVIKYNLICLVLFNPLLQQVVVSTSFVHTAYYVQLNNNTSMMSADG